jgi:APA family basic amino acid/polyamine antiporter
MLWLLGGLVALAGAFSYGELSSAMSRSGGEYHLLSEIYHPIVGFSSGWISITVGFTAPIAAASMALGAYGSSVILDLGYIAPEQKKIAALLLAFSSVTAVTIIHLFKDTVVSNFQVVFTTLKILLILSVIVLGFSIDSPTNINFFPSTQALEEIMSAPFAIALVYVMYAYSGWNASIYIADEVKNPGRNLPLSLFIGTLIVILLYVPLNSVFLYSTPLTEFKGQVDVGLIAAKHILGQSGGMIMGALIAFGLISTISSMVWAGPRVSMVIGEDTRILRFFAKKNNSGVPAVSLFVQYVIVLFFIFTSTFDTVVTYIGFLMTLSSLLTVIGVFVMRCKRPQMERPYMTWGYPVTPLFFIMVMSAILFFLIKEKPMITLAGCATIIVGLLIYWINQYVMDS